MDFVADKSDWWIKEEQALEAIGVFVSADTTLLNNESATDTVLEVADETGFTAGDQIYVGDERHTIATGGVAAGEITIDAPGLTDPQSIGVVVRRRFVTGFPNDAYKLRMDIDAITGGTPDVNPIMLTPYGIRHLNSLQIGGMLSFEAINGNAASEIGVGLLLRTSFYDDETIENGFAFIVTNDFNANTLTMTGQYYNAGTPTDFFGPATFAFAGFPASMRCFVMDDSDAGEPYVSIEVLQGAHDPTDQGNWFELWNANVPGATHMVGEYGDVAILSYAPPAYSPFAGDYVDIDDVRIFTAQPIVPSADAFPMIEDFTDGAWT